MLDQIIPQRTPERKQILNFERHLASHQPKTPRTRNQ